MVIDKEKKNQRSREYYQKNRDRILQRCRDYYAHRPPHVKPLKDSDILTQHHVKYKEIHGEDEVKIISISQHRRLHRRLRREGKCNISPEDMAKISTKANARTDGRKKSILAYRKSDRCKEKRSKYYRENTYDFTFYNPIEDDFFLKEFLVYNMHTGNLYYTACFVRSHSKIKYIKELEERADYLRAMLAEEKNDK